MNEHYNAGIEARDAFVAETIQRRVDGLAREMNRARRLGDTEIYQAAASAMTELEYLGARLGYKLRNLTRAEQDELERRENDEVAALQDAAP